jgi:GNAT superfamily N-acetyltransferase
LLYNSYEYFMMIADLRECSWLAHAVAHHVWKEWWRDERAFAHVRAKIDVSMAGSAFPFTLVAYERGTFIGTISVVESNIKARRDLSPWLSALWVDEQYRRRGWGSALLTSAIEKARGNGRHLRSGGVSRNAALRLRSWPRPPSESDCIPLLDNHSKT